MSLSKPKILINGCGITYQGSKEHKTWPNVLKVLGFDLVDVSGPAVSNQWILNKTFLALLANPTIDIAVVQLTMVGKLDVEVDHGRTEKLVSNDQRRNFVIAPGNRVIRVEPQSTADVPVGSIWPSSQSLDHQAKKFWHEFLFSPNLELEDIFCKLKMMEDYCHHKKIDLLVFQGYDLSWKPDQLLLLQQVIKNPANSLHTEYLNSPWYQYHDHENKNSVPCFPYQIQIAAKVAAYLTLDEIANKKLSNIMAKYGKKQ